MPPESPHISYDELDLQTAAAERTDLQFTLVRHALALQALRRMRDKSTPPPEFAEAIESLASIMIAEATRNLPTRQIAIETPLAGMTAQELSHQIILVPIMRAGLGMLNSAQRLFIRKDIHSTIFAGVKRDEATAVPQWYRDIDEIAGLDGGHDATFLILDPMLATGGSAIDVGLRIRSKYPHSQIIMAAMIAAPEGIKALNLACPEVGVFVAAVDSHLNEHAYIVPGLGDAGDRQFGT